MDSNLYDITDKMIEKIKEEGATHYTVSKNFDKPHQHLVSSVHFFKGIEKDENGSLNEVAYFSPAMHSFELGKLSGFMTIERKNNLDVENIKELPQEFKTTLKKKRERTNKPI